MISLTPVKRYAPPKYPTQTRAELDPKLLRKLPSRWEKNAAVVAAVGMLGAMSMASCGIRPTSTSGDSAPPAFTAECETEQMLVDGKPIPPACATEQMFVLEGAFAQYEFATEMDVTDETCELIDLLPTPTTGETWDTGELAGDVLIDIPSEQDFAEVMPTTDMPPLFAGGIGLPTYLSEQDALAIIKGMAESEGLNFKSGEPFEYNDQSIKLYDAEKQVAIMYNSDGYMEKSETHAIVDGMAIGVFYAPPMEEDLRAQVRDFIEWLTGQGVI